MSTPPHSVYFLLLFRELKGRSFTASVLAEAEKWLLARATTHLPPPPPPDLHVQDTAFHKFCRHRNTAVLRTACRVFQLSGPRYHSLIYQLAADGEYKLACDCACALGLFDKFDARSFCLPLLLEERLTTAEAYLEHSPRALRGLMSVLDELSDPAANRELLCGLCAAYPQLDSKLSSLTNGAEKLSGKPLARLIRRYAERFGLNLTKDMPKFARRAAQTDLHFWVSEFYDGGSKQLTLGCWRELLERKVEGEPGLQAELVDTLLRWDRQEAAHWSEQLGILTPALVAMQEAEKAAAAAKDEEEDWDTEAAVVVMQPSSSQLRGDASSCSSASIDSWTAESSGSVNQAVNRPESINYYQLPPAEDLIVFVDSVAGFESFLEEGLAGCCELGVDAEYATTHLTARVSLLQLATAHRVFLLDMEVLPTRLSPHHWQSLREEVFLSPDVALIGYGIRGDLKLLAKSWPALLGGVQTDSRAVISLELLKPRLAAPLQLPSVEEKGLSGMTAAVLGRPLQKGEQISDWSRRPLRPSQVRYAALDAFVGLEIFVSLRQRALNMGAVEVFARCVSEMVEPGKPRPKSAKKGASGKVGQEEKENVQEVQPFLTEPIRPSSLRYRYSVHCTVYVGGWV